MSFVTTVSIKKGCGLNCCGHYKKTSQKRVIIDSTFHPVKLVAQKDGSDVPAFILSSNTETV